MNYDSFSAVDFDRLVPYDARNLRRFTEMLDPESLTEEHTALVIGSRKFRGNESGDIPPCVHSLARMGVIVAPTVHRLRREYCDRFPEVQQWAAPPKRQRRAGA